MVVERTSGCQGGFWRVVKGFLGIGKGIGVMWEWVGMAGWVGVAFWYMLGGFWHPIGGFVAHVGASLWEAAIGRRLAGGAAF